MPRPRPARALTSFEMRQRDVLAALAGHHESIRVGEDGGVRPIVLLGDNGFELRVLLLE